MEYSEQLINLVQQGDTAAFKEAVKDKSDLSLCCDVHGGTLLHWAARTNNRELAEFLIDEKKAYMDLPDFRGASVLYYAAHANARDVVALLIARKADPRQVSAFSGKKAKDVASDNEVRQMLEEYTEHFESVILPNPFSNFAYRVADYWRTSLHLLLHPNGKGLCLMSCYQTSHTYITHHTTVY